MGMEDVVNKRLGKVGDGNIYAYEFISKMGQGGFGQVWKVSRKGEYYALKAPIAIEIKPGYLPENESYGTFDVEDNRIESEAKNWAKLTDKCPDAVVCLLDFNIEPFPWMLMELAECDLWKALRTKKASIKDFNILLTKLQKIHDAGVVHRDIKPGNILMVNGDWKFSDFGLSKLITRSSSGTTFGTPLYMAPEQISRSRFGMTSKRTDIWAMGIVLLRDFIGIDPYPDYDNDTIGFRITMDGPDLKDVPDKFKPALENVLEIQQDMRLEESMEFLKMMPHDTMPGDLLERDRTIGIHPVDEKYDLYEQYWTYDNEEKVMAICGKGVLTFNCPYDIEPETIILSDGITEINICHSFGVRKIILPLSVKTIRELAFFDCKSLQYVNLSPGITSINKDAFSFCKSLKSITIPSSVKTIGDYAFGYCESLESITIPSSVKTIGDYAFVGCNSLKTITIPSSVKIIGKFAFDSCKSLEKAYLSPDTEFPNSAFDDETEIIIVPNA